MQLDMMKAWEGATARLLANISLISSLAGALVFLPFFAFWINLPEDFRKIASGQVKVSEEVLIKVLSKFFDEFWWVILLLTLVQLVAKLALIILVADESRPTMAESIGKGAAKVIPYFLSAMVFAIGLGFISIFFITIASLTGIKVIAVMMIVLILVAAVYLSIRISLLSTVFCLTPSPKIIGALKTSWAMTKGNSGRLLGFYGLLFVAYVVVTNVIAIILGLPFALAGAKVALFGDAAIQATFQAIAMALFACIEVEIFRQLSSNADKSA